jgi:iron complex outermembrane recepter protein
MNSTLLLLSLLVTAASAADLSGVVTGPDGAPLPSVEVRIPALRLGAVTGPDGRYQLKDVPAGRVSVQFSRAGLRTALQTAELGAGSATLDARLEAGLLETSMLTIAAKPQAASLLSSPQAVSVLEGEGLRQARKSTVGETVASLPGVAAATTGVGIAKPVIRGLSSQRVVTVVDGLRQEGQQWGDEHAPEVAALGLDRVEVLRGPSSLIYGSDALGGVLVVQRRGAPLGAAAGSFGADAETEGRSVNRSGAGALSVRGGLGGGLAYRAGGSVRRTGDVETPERRLFNSGFEETTASGGLGLQRGWGSIMLDYDSLEQMLQVHEDPVASPGATKYQRVGHDRARAGLTVPFGDWKAELLGGWQRNTRREFENAEAADSKLRLVLDTFTQDLRVHHDLASGLRGSVGVSALEQRNDTQGTEKLIPGYRMGDFGVFAFEEYEAGPLTFSAGGRFDNRRLWVKNEGDLGVVSQTRNFQAFTGSLGAAWRFLDGWALAGSVGTGWRAPTPFELFVNGEHEGTGRFEVGSNALTTEKSLNTELSLRHRSERLTAELTGFRHRVRDFIFPLRQANASLVGVELSAGVQALDWLALEAAGSTLHARNEMTGAPLPQMPANRLRAGARVSRRALGPVTAPYAAFHANLAAKQHRVASGEATTAGYAVYDLTLGAETPSFGYGRLDLGVENLFNTKYRDHLSRYRTYALAPGRNVFVKYSVRFGSL